MSRERYTKHRDGLGAFHGKPKNMHGPVRNRGNLF